MNVTNSDGRAFGGKIVITDRTDKAFGQDAVPAADATRARSFPWAQPCRWRPDEIDVMRTPITFNAESLADCRHGLRRTASVPEPVMERRMKTTRAWTVAAIIAFANVLAGGQVKVRRIHFEAKPIIALLQPADQQVLIVHPTVPPAFADPNERPFVPAIVQENPIIITGRVIDKQPAFLTLRGRQDFTPAAMNEANWIGSQVTVLVDRVIQTIEAFPLAPQQRFTFIEDGDGTAVVNGVRVDTDTPWLWPIQSGKRYLITGRIKTERFQATGMWMEPDGGGNVRGQVRGTGRQGGPSSPPEPEFRTPFEDWTIEEASYWLDMEVQRRQAAKR
jgi:hypothetical protein